MTLPELRWDILYGEESERHLSFKFISGGIKET